VVVVVVPLLPLLLYPPAAPAGVRHDKQNETPQPLFEIKLAKDMDLKSHHAE